MATRRQRLRTEALERALRKLEHRAEENKLAYGTRPHINTRGTITLFHELEKMQKIARRALSTGGKIPRRRS